MRVVLEIRRFQPERTPAPYIDRFELDVDPESRLLDALVHIQRRIDPTLAMRRSCGHGVCGSDAMMIDGKERLACKTLIRDIVPKEGAAGPEGGSPVITVAPLRNLPVLRDLVVDQGIFFENYRSVKPYFIEPPESPPSPSAEAHASAPSPAPAPARARASADETRERLQTPDARAKIDEATDCILCLACYSACPIIREKNPRFIGPAAIVQAYRFQEDSRDAGFDDRRPALDRPDGVWPCESRFECTRVCPRGIRVTWHINQTKRRLTAARGSAPSGK